MSSIRLIFASSFALLFTAACSAATEGPSTTTDGEIPGTRVSVEAMKGGCRWVCPKCLPNQTVCPTWPCHLECPNGGTPCGDTVCKGGDVCCNESCGICTAPGGACIDLYCAPTGCTQIALCVEGNTWDPNTCACIPTV